MMKKIALVLFILLSGKAFAQQQGDVILVWKTSTTYAFSDYKKNIPQFGPENFSYDDGKGTIAYTLKLPQSSSIDEKSLVISNVVYENISAASLLDLDAKEIPATISATLRNITARESNFALINLSPIVKDGQSYKRVLSFSYQFSSGAKRATVSRNFNTITNSVLASGEWYRFYVEKSGAYILTKPFLQQLGLNVAAINPRKIKIYGNGGRMIPLKNGDFYPDDLTENAVTVTGEADGVFNDVDFVAFYAEGVDQFSAENATSNNLYSTKSYYYINVSGADGKRINEINQPTSAATQTFTTFDDYQYHELDLVNIVRLGRRWFGEEFSSTDSREFDFALPNAVPGSNVLLTVVAAATSLTSTSLKVDANNQTVGTIPFSAISTSDLARGGSLINVPATASELFKVKLTYENNGVPGSKGYLDYIAIKAQRNLKGYGTQFIFQKDDAATGSGIGNYQIQNASSISEVWDITDIFNVGKYTNTDSNTINFKVQLGEARKYLALVPSNFLTPLKESQTRVFNQNLKGTVFNDAQGQFKDIDYLIITPYIFYTQAEKLANFHRNYSQMNVKVITTESIYQEFCSGKQDIGAIRNFVKYVYNNASTPAKRVKYLNLFGDASYDFKNRLGAARFSNFVPIYHALNSFTTGEASFSSDDFFGLMDDNEGNLDPSPPGSLGLDIAVGRMIVDSPLRGEQMVNKVIEYHDIKSYGGWRNNYVFIADDADISGDATLQQKQNNMADIIVTEKPFINAQKILLDSYEQVTSSGGSRYPRARQDFFNAFGKGALVFNYLGHGGEDGLAQERIWEQLDGQTLANRYKYPLFITITCDFSRFDNPFRPTAGEQTYWNPRGGAISMISTVRAVGQSTGESFNFVLSRFLFAYGSDNYPTIAEALRLAKNDFSNNTHVVFMIGDPAMKLAIARPKIVLTKVNGAPITGAVDNLASLGFVTLSGEVLDENNNPLPSYKGELAVQVFDKNLTRQTLNNDNNAPPINFQTLGETVFRGNASVNNGQFEFGFVVPRDIAIPVGNGRISFYAKRQQILLDKSGFNNSIQVGGINVNAPADNIGPTARLYMNDESFVSGGLTNNSPFLLVFLEDENGINTASGIGHDIVAILDGNESSPYKLNDYYETELDNYKKGKLKFPFRDLSIGLHVLTFKAFDVYNNPVEASITFIVADSATITISNVLNYPNPFVNYTQFWFTHNRPFEPLDVQVQVMTITGKVVWTKNQVVTTDGFLSREITWDGKDDFGDKLGKGVYVYKLTVKSMVSGTKTSKYEKLVIL